MNLRINYILPKSSANGPGTRFTIWVQGCSIRCPGCSNIDTWDPSGGKDVSVDEIVEQIKATEGLDGITITGGEPLDQFDAVYELCRRVTQCGYNFPFFSIFITTGYSWSMFLSWPYLKLLKVIDILCVGPFEQDKICQGDWKGSSNQRILYFTDLGQKQSEMPKTLKEVFVSTKGDSLETGFTT